MNIFKQFVQVDYNVKGDCQWVKSSTTRFHQITHEKEITLEMVIEYLTDVEGFDPETDDVAFIDMTAVHIS